MPIMSVDSNSDIATVVSALRRDGAVIVRNLIESDLVDTVRAELRPELDARGLKTRSNFNGSLTLRIGQVLATAPSAAAIVDHDMVVRVADEILLPHCATYQVSSLTAIEILPGEAPQALHRDDTIYPIDRDSLSVECHKSKIDSIYTILPRLNGLLDCREFRTCVLVSDNIEQSLQL